VAQDARGAEPEVVQRRAVASLCLQALGGAVDAVFTSEAYGEGFAQELTRCFRARDPMASEVRHVLVDLERRQVPISSSRILADVHAHRAFLSPCVYASFVGRVCLLGGESTGKSTLAEALARHLATLSVAEYGRELWVRKSGRLAFEDLLHIAEVQAAREDEAAGRANRWLVCDTSPLTTLFYSRHLFGRADPLTREARRAELRRDRTVARRTSRSSRTGRASRRVSARDRMRGTASISRGAGSSRSMRAATSNRAWGGSWPACRRRPTP
jgi:NadR type nicotinamide-nucleotide adenylyltransferase